MIRYLKKGRDVEAVAAADAKVRTTVEDLIRNVAERGDAAVREYSQVRQLGAAELSPVARADRRGDRHTCPRASWRTSSSRRRRYAHFAQNAA